MNAQFVYPKDIKFPDTKQIVLMGVTDTRNEISALMLYFPEADTSFVVPINVPGFKASAEEIHSIGAFLKGTPGLYIITYNSHFLLSRLWNLGIRDLNVVSDVNIMALMLQVSKNADLVQLVAENLGRKLPTLKEAGVYDNEGVCQINDTKVQGYLALLPYLVYHVEKVLMGFPEWTQVCSMYSLEMKFHATVARMLTTGLRVQYGEYIKSISTYSDKVQDALTAFRESTGGEVQNPGSNKEMCKYLYETKGLTPMVRTAKGAPSVNDEALSYYEDLPAVKALREYKHVQNVLSSMNGALPYMQMSYFYPTVKQVGEDATSRVYTEEPSVTQFPMEIRKTIVPEPGKKFVYMDWSAAELFVLAYLSQCKTLLNLYEQGEDIHKYVSEQILGRPCATNDEREISKILSFAVLYGSKGSAVATALKIPKEEGEAMVGKYFALFPEFKTHWEKMVKFATQTGFTRTLKGRVRYLPGIQLSDHPADLERRAVNTSIQGTVGDCLKEAAVKANLFDNVRFMVGVFDAMLLEVDEDMPEDAIKEMLDKLSDFGKFKFRYKWGTGKTWAQAQEGA